MEDVLSVYRRPYDPKRPVVCMDESSKQLVQEIRQSLPAKPGSEEKYDCEYKRNGTSNIFVFTEPLRGKRYFDVTDRRTKIDWAWQIKKLLDVHYPDAEKVVLVMDNLNTHSGASLYSAFEPEEALRLLDRLEIHYTPKHGSWLNMAEIEFRLLTSLCLSRYIPTKKALATKVAKWERQRNEALETIDWQFKTDDARIKLKRLYPDIIKLSRH
jgi:hypothetical protein